MKIWIYDGINRAYKCPNCNTLIYRDYHRLPDYCDECKERVYKRQDIETLPRYLTYDD